jgi:hypothetical protein
MQANGLVPYLLSTTPRLSVCGSLTLLLFLKALILKGSQTVENFYQLLIRLSRNLAQQLMS